MKKDLALRQADKNKFVYLPKIHQIPPGAFRFFLAFLVVVHHTFPLRMGGWAVGLFFVLSGYWIARMWSKKYSLLPNPIRTFLVSRWWRLAPTFLAVQLIVAGLNAFGQPIGNASALSDWRWWTTQLTIAGNSQFTRLLPPSWSLDLEMQFYLIAPLLVTGLVGRGRLESIGITAILLVWGWMQLSLSHSMEVARLDAYAGFFAIGMAASITDWRPSRMVVNYSLAVLALTLAVVWFVPTLRALVWVRGVDGFGMSPFASSTFLYATVLLSCPLALSSVRVRTNEFDRWLGDLSYPLYMVHWIPRDLYYMVVDWSQPAYRNVLLLLACWGASILGAILLMVGIDRPFDRLRLRWLGTVVPTIENPKTIEHAENVKMAGIIIERNAS